MQRRAAAASCCAYCLHLLFNVRVALSPLPQDSGTLFIVRVFDVMLGAVYAIGIASLLRSMFRAR